MERKITKEDVVQSEKQEVVGLKKAESVKRTEETKKTKKDEKEKKRETYNKSKEEKKEKEEEKSSEKNKRKTLKSEDEEDDESDVTFSDDDENVEEKHQKKSWSARTKQGIGNSAVGKALFNKFVDKETKKLINALMLLVEKDRDKRAAKKLKSDIFRIAVKVIVLHEEKYVSADDFLKLRNNFRRICSATRNGYRTGVIEEVTAERISELIYSFAIGIKEIIQKFVSATTIDRIDTLVTYLGTTDFLVRTSKLKEFDTVAYVLAYYLQET